MKTQLTCNARTVLCHNCQQLPKLQLISNRNLNNLARARRRQNKRVLEERERLFDEKTQREMNEIKTQDLEPYRAMDWETLPKQNYSSQQSGTETLPFVKPLNEPYPNAPFNEVHREPLLVWNDFQERYELRDKRILSEKTKQILLSMNRRFPTVWTKEQLCRNFGLSYDTIDFIFWEHEMRQKYKIPIDLDSIKLLEAYCGTDDIIESKAHTMMAYSDVTGDPFYSQAKYSLGSPLVLPENELNDHLYSWQRKQKFNPNLSKDQFEILPNSGSGSGKIINNIDKLERDGDNSYLVVDISDEKLEFLNNKNMNVKVRECNGDIRWATMEEVHYAKEKEYPNNETPYSRIMKKRKWKGQFGRKSRRLFPRRPYMDRHYVEHHWQ